MSSIYSHTTSNSEIRDKRISLSPSSKRKPPRDAAALLPNQGQEHTLETLSTLGATLSVPLRYRSGCFITHPLVPRVPSPSSNFPLDALSFLLSQSFLLLSLLSLFCFLGLAWRTPLTGIVTHDAGSFPGDECQTRQAEPKAGWMQTRWDHCLLAGPTSHWKRQPGSWTRHPG